MSSVTVERLLLFLWHLIKSCLNVKCFSSFIALVAQWLYRLVTIKLATVRTVSFLGLDRIDRVRLISHCVARFMIIHFLSSRPLIRNPLLLSLQSCHHNALVWNLFGRILLHSQLIICTQLWHYGATDTDTTSTWIRHLQVVVPSPCRSLTTWWLLIDWKHLRMIWLTIDRQLLILLIDNFCLFWPIDGWLWNQSLAAWKMLWFIYNVVSIIDRLVNRILLNKTHQELFFAVYWIIMGIVNYLLRSARVILVIVVYIVAAFD